MPMFIKRLILTVISRRNAEKVKTALACLLYYSGLAWLQSWRGQRGGYIIMYHSVGADNAFWDNVIQTASFRQQLQWLSTHKTLVPVQDFVDRINQSMPIPDDWIALSFDDGYRDNLSNALPVLEHFKAPASFYATWNVLSGVQEFFYDRIQAAVLHTGQPAITLVLNDQSISLPSTTRQQKLDAIQEIVLSIRNLDEARRAECVQQVEAACKCPVATVRDAYLDEQALRELSASSVAEIGSHTLSHPDLATCDPEALHQELNQSRENLQSLTGSSINGLAYPFGKRANYSPAVLRQASLAGYRYALTTNYGVVHPQSNPFELPRVGARDSLTRLKVNLMGISL